MLQVAPQLVPGAALMRSPNWHSSAAFPASPSRPPPPPPPPSFPPESHRSPLPLLPATGFAGRRAQLHAKARLCQPPSSISPISGRPNRVPLRAVRASRRSSLDSREAVLAKRKRSKEDRSRAFRDFKAVAGVVSALFAGLAVYLRYTDTDFFLDEDLNVNVVPIISGLLFAASFQFSSPYQLLLVFFGRFETERPVDWVAARLAGMEDPGDQASYDVPVQFQVASATIIGLSGVTLASLISKYIGDTWALSTAVGTAFFSFLYEVGRPTRLSPEEVAARERTWQNFREFADASLVKAGSTHESEIIGAFVSTFPQYKEDIEGEKGRKQIQRFLSQWNPYTERTPYGFYKNVAFSSSFKEGMTKSL